MNMNMFLGMQMLAINHVNIRKFVSLMVLAYLAMLVLMPQTALAAMPWEGPLRQIVGSLCGPVAQGFAIVSIVGAGLMIAFGEVKGWIHHMLIVLFAIGIIVSAPSLLALFGVASSYSCS